MRSVPFHLDIPCDLIIFFDVRIARTILFWLLFHLHLKLKKKNLFESQSDRERNKYTQNEIVHLLVHYCSGQGWDGLNSMLVSHRQSHQGLNQCPKWNAGILSGDLSAALPSWPKLIQVTFKNATSSTQTQRLFYFSPSFYLSLLCWIISIHFLWVVYLACSAWPYFPVCKFIHQYFLVP